MADGDRPTTGSATYPSRVTRAARPPLSAPMCLKKQKGKPITAALPVEVATGRGRCLRGLEPVAQRACVCGPRRERPRCTDGARKAGAAVHGTNGLSRNTRGVPRSRTKATCCHTPAFSTPERSPCWVSTPPARARIVVHVRCLVNPMQPEITNSRDCSQFSFYILSVAPSDISGLHIADQVVDTAHTGEAAPQWPYHREFGGSRPRTLPLAAQGAGSVNSVVNSASTFSKNRPWNCPGFRPAGRVTSTVCRVSGFRLDTSA